MSHLYNGIPASEWATMYEGAQAEVERLQSDRDDLLAEVLRLRKEMWSDRGVMLELKTEVDRYREALANLLASYLQRQNPWEPSVEAARRLLGGGDPE